MKHALLMDDPVTEAILDQLDDCASTAPVNRRRSPRFRYRVETVVEFVENDESVFETVPCRDLSSHGISFLLTRFVDVGTAVRVHLIGTFAQMHVVSGRVSRVRYLAGTRGVHECGVVFPRPIEVEGFLPEGP